jgi:hypothetical protein
VNLPLGVVAIATTFAWVRESRDPAPRGLDPPGQATLVERRAREPMLALHLFRLPALAGAQPAVFAMSASFFALFL